LEIGLGRENHPEAACGQKGAPKGKVFIHVQAAGDTVGENRFAFGFRVSLKQEPYLIINQVPSFALSIRIVAEAPLASVPCIKMVSVAESQLQNPALVFTSPAADFLF
jgi:hypothetical protein